MAILLQYIVIISLLFLNINVFHSIHISYGEASLKEDEIYGRITFYKDDFILALKNWKGTALKNLNNKEFDLLKLEYLQNHFTLVANQNKKLMLLLTGNNEDESSIWFTFKFISNEKIESLEMKYNVLINEFNDQMNLLNISSSSGDQSLIFNASNQQLKIKS